MRKVSLILNALLCILICGNTHAQNRPADNKSLLWKISGKEMQKPSYLFGTIHIICKDEYIWTNKMKKSLESCNEVCMEMDMDDPSIIMQIASAMQTDGKRLEDYFTDAEYLQLERYFKDSLGISIAMFSNMKPVVLQTLLTTTAITCDSTISYEVKISETAKSLNIDITGLETPAEQIKLLEQIPTDSIVKELIEAASGKETNNDDYAAMIEAYKTQDIPALHQLILKAKEQGDNLDAFLDERNEKWIDRMTERMDQKSVFFAVGAGHLWGSKGLITLLREQGYVVTPVK